MLEAVSYDWSQLPDWKVHIAWDQRFGDWENPIVQVHSLGSAIEDWKLKWLTIAKEVDFVLVIAPEIGGELLGILTFLRRSIESLSSKNRPLFLNADEAFLIAASDKLETALCLQRAGLVHPETKLLSRIIAGDSLPITSNSTWVVKPRDGAGCEELRIARSKAQFDSLVKRFASDSKRAERFVVQPWLDGPTGSIAVLCGRGTCVLPAMTQHFAFDSGEDGDSMEYRGGRGCWLPFPQSDLESFARSIVLALPGKPVGWIGIDFVVAESTGDEKQLVAIEINPRLTSSYLGLRKIVQPNLAQGLYFALTSTAMKPNVRMEPIEFHVVSSAIPDPPTDTKFR